MKNIDELREQLREYDTLYRQGKPVISDTEYDKLFSKLKILEAESGGDIPADSPTQKPGSDLSESSSLKQGEVVHKIPMLSIENVYSTGELLEFGSRVEKYLNERRVSGTPQWDVELKIDGVSLALIYEGGKLVQGITRGSGLVGNDVSYNLDLIIDIPKTIPNKHRLEVRGEVYMLNSDLSVLNEQQQADGEDVYKNARNITTGTISLKNPDEETEKRKRLKILKERQRRKLHFFAHSTGSDTGIKALTHWDFLQELKSCGIPLAPYAERFDTFADAVKYCESLYNGEKDFLSALDFETDGLVLKADSFAVQKALGATGHHPRWVIAYKVEKYEAETKLLSIIVQVGKQGSVTPVAELEPVEIAGTTVSRASLHNAEEIERKDIRIGDTVIVEKAGKIIPHIVRVEKHLRTSSLPVFQFPKECPVCNYPLSKDDDGVFIRCNNPQCPAQFKEKLRYFAGRNAMDIEGLGGNIIEKLVGNGLVRTFSDLYRLKERQAEILKIERLGQKIVDNLLAAIEKSKERDFAHCINALSIRHVGSRTATILAQKFGTWGKLRSATETELSAINEIGEVTARNIADFFRNEKEMLDELLQNFNIQEPESASAPPAAITAGSLAGQTIVVTGTLEHFKRSEIEDVITKHGGKPSSGVSPKTSFVLTGKDPGSKLTKAQQLGIRIVYEQEFLEMLG